MTYPFPTSLNYISPYKKSLLEGNAFSASWGVSDSLQNREVFIIVRRKVDATKFMAMRASFVTGTASRLSVIRGVTPGTTLDTVPIVQSNLNGNSINQTQMELSAVTSLQVQPNSLLVETTTANTPRSLNNGYELILGDSVYAFWFRNLTSAQVPMILTLTWRELD